MARLPILNTLLAAILACSAVPSSAAPGSGAVAPEAATAAHAPTPTVASKSAHAPPSTGASKSAYVPASTSATRSANAQKPAAQNPAAASKATAVQKGQVTVIRFPDRTMGQLFYVDSHWDPNGEVPRNRFYALAKGPVQIQAGVPLCFVPNTSLYDHPELLDQFPAGSLMALDLKNMDFPDEFLARVGNLKGLKGLILNGAEITDDRLKFLNGLESLWYLDISRTLATGSGLHQITHSPDLRRLDLSWTSVTPQLGTILKNFPRLTTLFVSRGKMKDRDLPALAKTTTLEHLKLSENYDITDSGMKALLPLKHLSCLEVAETRVTISGLAQLKGLALTSLFLDKQFKKPEIAAQLNKYFPRAQLHFEERHNNSVPFEVFSPLH